MEVNAEVEGVDADTSGFEAVDAIPWADVGIDVEPVVVASLLGISPSP